MSRLKGIILIIVGSILWGLSGPMMEWVFGVTNMSVPFFINDSFNSSWSIIIIFFITRKKRYFCCLEIIPVSNAADFI